MDRGSRKGKNRHNNSCDLGCLPRMGLLAKPAPKAQVQKPWRFGSLIGSSTMSFQSASGRDHCLDASSGKVV
jgi:hypothetical protein